MGKWETWRAWLRPSPRQVRGERTRAIEHGRRPRWEPVLRMDRLFLAGSLQGDGGEKEPTNGRAATPLPGNQEPWLGAGRGTAFGSGRPWL